MVHAWAISDYAHTISDYVKYDGQNVEPIHIFLSGSGGTGTSHSVEGIYKDKSKTLHYHCKEPEKPRVLLLVPDTGVSALNRGRITINSGYGIRLGTKLLGLNDKSEVALRNRL